MQSIMMYGAANLLATQFDRLGDLAYLSTLVWLGIV
jgi:hypothetical protein